MRAVIQRVSQASVTIDGGQTAAIGRGLLVLVGVELGDTPADAEWLTNKTVQLRIFPDEAGKMNLDVRASNGSLLVVSQFTLLGDAGRSVARSKQEIALITPPRMDLVAWRVRRPGSSCGIWP